jgi:hypothetical protein
MFWQNFICRALKKIQKQYNSCHSPYGKWTILMRYYFFHMSHKWWVWLHTNTKTLLLRQHNVRYLPYHSRRDLPQQLPGPCTPMYHSTNMLDAGNRITVSMRHKCCLLLSTDWIVISLLVETRGSALLVPKLACPWALYLSQFHPLPSLTTLTTHSMRSKLLSLPGGHINAGF